MGRWSARDGWCSRSLDARWTKVSPARGEAPPAYKELGDWKPAQPNDQNLGGEWWKVFQDPQLDALRLRSTYRIRI